MLNKVEINKNLENKLPVSEGDSLSFQADNLKTLISHHFQEFAKSDNFKNCDEFKMGRFDLENLKELIVEAEEDYG